MLGVRTQDLGVKKSKVGGRRRGRWYEEYPNRGSVPRSFPRDAATHRSSTPGPSGRAEGVGSTARGEANRQVVPRMGLCFPKDIATEVGRMLSRGEGGIFALGVGDGGVGPVAGEDEGVVGERVEALGDGCNALLEVGGRLGAAGAAGEEDVAREEDAARQIAGAAGGMAGRVQGADRACADGDLFAV